MFEKGHKFDSTPKVKKDPITHTVRTSDMDGTVTFNNYYRSFAVKVFCTECLGWSSPPSECTSKLCPLFPFRGKTLKTRGKKMIEESEAEEEIDDVEDEIEGEE